MMGQAHSAIAVLSFAKDKQKTKPSTGISKGLAALKPHQAEGYFSSLLAFIAKDKEKKPFSSFRYTCSRFGRLSANIDNYSCSLAYTTLNANNSSFTGYSTRNTINLHTAVPLCT